MPEIDPIFDGSQAWCDLGALTERQATSEGGLYQGIGSAANGLRLSHRNVVGVTTSIFYVDTDFGLMNKADLRQQAILRAGDLLF